MTTHFQRDSSVAEQKRQRRWQGLAANTITMLIPFDLPALETKHPLIFFVFYRKIFSTDMLFLEF